jgi:hypothetical protein
MLDEAQEKGGFMKHIGIDLQKRVLVVRWRRRRIKELALPPGCELVY